ncbi:cell division protein MraZ [Candidatus Mycoplasma haemominutum 'Birmingham 1']|uniref:Transcriptional regulator MraZ n=2 Tax=Candidatus Mycoplasma haematominutum TaxID=209446 RepID=G8C306_9MOLU|nr:cell division protein MraZ [Candidatus Mycoplasma haematominutum 'Birmingham 1']
MERIDKKGRVHIPLLWRHVLKDKAVVTKGHDGCLALWTTDFFQYFSRLKVDRCTTEAERKIEKRLFIGNARTLDIDSKMRIIIPEDMLELFEEDGIMYFIGVGDYIEIWTKELFNSWKESQMPKDVPDDVK